MKMSVKFNKMFCKKNINGADLETSCLDSTNVYYVIRRTTLL